MKRRLASNHRAVGPIDIMQIETLHHANKQKTEAYIVDLLSWLNYLVNRSKASTNKGGAVRPLIRSPVRSPSKEDNQQGVEKDANTSQVLESETRESSNTSDSGLEERNGDKLDDSETGARPPGNSFVHIGLGCEKSLDAIDRV